MIHQLLDGKFVTTTSHHPRPILSVEYVNPFIESVNNVLETMLNCSTKRHGLVIKESKTPRYLLSALIDVTGQSDGLVVLSLLRNASVGVLPLSILFESDIGPFAIEVGFSEPYVAPDTGENEAACVSV